ncbi:MAG: formate dehydrogenase, partial [Candidatus Dormibacteraceae bacterium]
NMAECHPVGFQWVMEAKLKGAKVIHVDPRYTRTSAQADLHVPIRAGSDIVFLGGIINHILSNGREFREYVQRYTNAAVIIEEGFKDTEELDGYFSGWDPEKGGYDKSTWQYQGLEEMAAAGQRDRGAQSSEKAGGAGGAVEHASPPTDPTLEDPRCVFQHLKRHYRRYTPEMVERACGVPRAKFLEVAEALCENSGRERTSAICYAVGWTQHTTGVQTIRTAAMIQLLLGNIGRPGGGILALRGHASIQGSTDIPTLYNLLPGYIPMPYAHEDSSLDGFVNRHSSQAGGWGGMRAYTISLLKAYFGPHASADNEWGFGYLPRIDRDDSTYQSILRMTKKEVKGFFVVGENPAVGSANSVLHRHALAGLDWLVVRDLVEIETASFWYDSPEIRRGEMRTEDIQTEVFFLPAAAHVEKEGSFTNTQRLLQWHHKAVEPRQDCRSELWFYYHLGRILRERLEASDDARDLPVLNLQWVYPTSGKLEEPSAEAVLREINGWDENGRALDKYQQLKPDGSTTCGCWIYCGCFAGEKNQAARRKSGLDQSWVAPEWGWAWPANRRLLYNRASADPAGAPWSDRKSYVWWDEKKGSWTGHDTPDFTPDKRPDYQPPEGAEADAALAGDKPFVMQGDGRAWLWVPSGLSDGPMSTHYEPAESPVINPLYEVQSNPTREMIDHPLNPSNNEHDVSSPRYPFVITSYRLTEHHTAGGMSRTLPVLSELQPAMFCEVSPQLARERGLANGGWATISTSRSEIEARVLVTRRMTPLEVDGHTVHQVGVPYHWGSRGITKGDSANDLFPLVLDPNVHIQEVKAATCDIRPGRRSR